jgi:hypothetical protein
LRNLEVFKSTKTQFNPPFLCFSTFKRTFKYKSSHPEDLILGNKESRIKTRSAFQQNDSLLGLISMIEPKTVDEALSDDG